MVIRWILGEWILEAYMHFHIMTLKVFYIQFDDL